MASSKPVAIHYLQLDRTGIALLGAIVLVASQVLSIGMNRRPTHLFNGPARKTARAGECKRYLPHHYMVSFLELIVMQTSNSCIRGVYCLNIPMLRKAEVRY